MKARRYPPRSKGRRKEDQVANRILHLLKLIGMVLAGCFVLYQTVIGMYVQGALSYQSIELRPWKPRQ